MRTPAPAFSQTDNSPAGWERTLLDRQLERLDRLAEMGMAIAGAIERRAEQADAELAHVAIDFARASRAVRITLALQSRLVQDFKTPARGARTAAAAPQTYRIRWDTAASSDAHTRKVQDAVRELAEDRGLDDDAVERLTVEAAERVERDDIYADLKTRQVEEIVARICEDLGLTSPIAEAMAGGGPPAERSEERGVEGAGNAHSLIPLPIRDSS